MKRILWKFIFGKKGKEGNQKERVKEKKKKERWAIRIPILLAFLKDIHDKGILNITIDKESKLDEVPKLKSLNRFELGS